ncbi:hypothetical protein XAPC_379 [Xanthomonas citri pv. punicae str. LMG 859]|nr:hypothetical protein XAPC_379 [Xanthomonas citri pv. punicae str. LMG 859]
MVVMRALPAGIGPASALASWPVLVTAGASLLLGGSAIAIGVPLEQRARRRGTQFATAEQAQADVQGGVLRPPRSGRVRHGRGRDASQSNQGQSLQEGDLRHGGNRLHWRRKK